MELSFPGAKVRGNEKFHNSIVLLGKLRAAYRAKGITTGLLKNKLQFLVISKVAWRQPDRQRTWRNPAKHKTYIIKTVKEHSFTISGSPITHTPVKKGRC